ncbi:MAG: holo-ACP synthase [Candidatus Acetothermia bacterium]
MIEGLGVDLVSVERLRSVVERRGEEFLQRVFTEKEREYCLSRSRKFEHLAGRFAAKESIVKAVGHKLPWLGIEVLSGEDGNPSAKLVDEEIVGRPVVHVSISHTASYAIAVAILEAES